MSSEALVEGETPAGRATFAAWETSGQVFYGSSFICDHRGDKRAELGKSEEGVITADFDLARIREDRASMGFFRDRRPELYGRLSRE